MKKFFRKAVYAIMGTVMVLSIILPMLAPGGI
jgi:hypothetical protein